MSGRHLPFKIDAVFSVFFKLYGTVFVKIGNGACFVVWKNALVLLVRSDKIIYNFFLLLILISL